VTVGGGSVVDVEVGSPIGGRELVGTFSRVVGGTVVVGSSDVGGCASGSVGGAVGTYRRRVVVGAGVVVGASVVEVDVTVVGPPSKLNGGSDVVEVSVGSGRGAVTGARLAASVRISVCVCCAWAATEKLVTIPTPHTALATPAMRRSKRAG
jgi:hypothetical protein